MRFALVLSLLIFGCSTGRRNRACILAENALKQAHKDGSCTPESYGETRDYATWRFDGGERLCYDAVGTEHPLQCTVEDPTTDEKAASAAAEAKAKIEAEAKAKVEAETKARAEAAGSGSAKGPK